MIPGGNDSFGTGISAGGAQVMGQSAGLNDLVKLGMARQKQRQQRLPNVPTQNIDTSQLKMADLPEIMQGVQTYRDKSMQANLENNPQSRYELDTQANNALAQVQQKIDQSKNSQAKLQSFRSNIANPNFDHTQDDDYNKGLSAYEISKSGSAEEKEAEANLPLTHYTKVDVPGIEKALNNEVYKSAQMDINQNAPGAVKDMQYNEKRVASGQSMMATLNNFSMSNKATNNMFDSQGKDILSNPGNDQYLQNLKSKYNIDLEDPSQVGQANYIDHKVEGLKQFNINKRSQLYPGKGLSINLGEQKQPDGESQALNGIETPGGVGDINASKKEIEANGGTLPNTPTTYRMNYNRYLSSGGKSTTIAGGPVFTVSDGKTILAHPGTKFHMVGTSDQYKFKEGQTINGYKMDGGYANSKTAKYIDAHPNSEIANKFTNVNITHGYMEFPSEDGGVTTREVFAPTENVDTKSLGKSTGKGEEAKVNADNKNFVNGIRVESNKANPNNQADIQRSYKGKMPLPGYKKSK